jgi:hypothetical protein
MEKKRILKTLSVREKSKLIDEVEKGTRKKKDIAAEFGIPANTLSTILKEKEKIRKAVEESRHAPERKRLKTSSFPKLEDAMFAWVKNMRDRNVPLQGGLIREQAEKFAKEMGIQSFQASVGWLDKFKARNGIVQKVMSGESASVPEVDYEDYCRNVLPSLLAGYNPNDIFNADETGLFFKCLPEKTLAFKSENCHGGKRSKVRITVMVGANMTGTEKLKLLVIGKSAKPRCFAGVKSLPVDYKNNNKAWMTTAIFEPWLLKLDRKFHREGRKVLLFVDNCPAHPKITEDLKSIRLVFLPPNMTSKVQPMDQGVIKNLKQIYRKKCVQRVIRNIETKKESHDINLLDAIVLIQKSWDEVKTTTIANCFRKAGFLMSESCENEETQENEESEPEEWKRFQNCISVEVDFQTFVDVDENLETTDYPSETDILHQITSNDEQESDQDEDDATHIQNTPPTGLQALDAAKTIRAYIHAQSSVEDQVFSAINVVENFLDNKVSQNMQQKKLTDFFQKL